MLKNYCDFVQYFSTIFVTLHDFSLLTRYLSNDIKAGLLKVNSISPSNFSSLSLESSEYESEFRALEMSSVDNFLFEYLFATF